MRATATATAVGPAGAYLSPPVPTSALPQTIPANDDCTRLVQTSAQGVRGCATVTTAKGTITAVRVLSGHSQYVDVWRRDRASAVLVLSGLEVGGTDGHDIELGTVDPAHDGDRKIAVVLVGAQGTPPSSDPVVDGYDLVDAPGVVSLHRTLAAGAVQLWSGGVVDWSSDGPASGTWTATYLTFSDGAWRVTRETGATALPAGRHDAIAAPADP